MLFQPELRKKAPVEKSPGTESAYKLGKRGKTYAGYGRNSFTKFLPNWVGVWFRHIKVQEIRIYMLFQPELRKKVPVEKRRSLV